MVTASYVSEDMRKMETRVKDAGIVILNEVCALVACHATLHTSVLPHSMLTNDTYMLTSPIVSSCFFIYRLVLTQA